METVELELELVIIPPPNTIMPRAAPKAAPWETPRVEAEARGLRSTHCITAPEAARIISFVGLIAPHMMRFFVGKDHRYLIPGSAVCGALLLILADAAAKLIAPPVILPIGAIMSFIGGPVFLILLFRGRGGND